jgi:hypothetical protein
VASFFDRRILEHYRVFHRTASTHRSECDAVLVHIHTNNRICIGLTGDSVILVRDSDMEPQLIVLMNDFSSPHSPVVIGERGSEALEVVGAATEFTFDVVAWFGTNE